MFRRIAQLGVLSGVVALLAYVQNRIMVQTLGAGAVIDAYYLAQTLPMAIVTVFGTLALALFVPLFASEAGPDAGRGAVGLGAVAAGAIALLMVVQVPVGRALGFWSDSGPGSGWLIAISAGAWFYGLSFYARAVAVGVERADWFVWAQIANAVVFIVVLASGVVRDIGTLSLAFAGCALVQLVLVVVPLVRAGLARPTLAMPEGLREVLRTGFVTSLAATLLMQGAVAVDRWFAAQLGTGVVTTYYVADRIMQMLLALVATAMGLVVFPRMAAEDPASGSAVTGKSLVGVVVFLVPIASVLWAYAPGVVRVLFGGGRFDADAVSATARFLRVLALALVPTGLMFVLPRRLQAVRAFGTHALIAGLFVGVDWALKLMLTKRFGVAGLAPATVAAATVAALAYAGVLSRRGLMALERGAVKDMAVATLLGVSHAAIAGSVPGGEDAFLAAPLALAGLWLTAAALGGRYERRALTLAFGREVSR